VICPRHGSKFDVCTGRPLSLPAYLPVDTFPVRVDEDGIVKIEVP
jgi:3-phenylpropionate/trans-cinnamate dioxygenase ferredoxin subunit